MSGLPHEGLSLCQPVTELLVWECGVPPEGVHVAGVHQLVGSWELDRTISGSLHCPGILQALHDDQEVGVDVQHEVAGRLCSRGPVVGAPAPPHWTVSVSLPQLIPEVQANNQGVGEEGLGHSCQGLEPHLLRVVVCPPETFSVLLGAAPASPAVVVVEDDHQTRLSQPRHHRLEDWHGALTHQLGVSREPVGLNEGIVVELLQGEGESDAVESETADGVGDGGDGLSVKAVDHMSLHVRSVPVDTGELDSVPIAVHHHHLAAHLSRGEGEHLATGGGDGHHQHPQQQHHHGSYLSLPCHW